MTDTLIYEDEVRAKYGAADLKDMAAKGHAMKNANGDPSYPIGDAADLAKAILAVGRGGADHDAIRAHIIKNAARLGLSSQIPDNWNVDGSLKQENDAELDSEDRAVCPTCDGKKTIMDGHRKCPDCNGTGVQQNNDPTPADAEVTALLKEASDVLARLRAAQGQDPDGKTDPDDQDVSDALDKAAGQIDKANVAQAADNKPERARKRRHRSSTLAPEFRLSIAREIRLYGTHGLEVRDAPAVYGDHAVEVTGSPIVYNAPYSVRDMMGEFEETMLPGVAANVLPDADCRFLINHAGLPLARTLSGTMKFSDTPSALTFSAIIDTRSSTAADLIVAIERGDVSQMSCGFVVADDTWSSDWSERSIHRFEELLDVSAVTYPASPTTSIDIANRMMMEVPVESRARVQKLWTFAATELRAGEPLAAEYAQHIKNATQALHTVLDNAGEQIPGGPDGTQNAPDPSPASASDGSGSRGAATATELRLELDLLRARRHVA